MRELTAENAPEYLRERGWVGPEGARVEVLAGGVSNVVLRVIAGDRLFVLKQSRPQLRTRDPWFSDVSRVYREQEVMQTLAGLLPPGTVPEVLHVDRDNFVFAMSHAPPEARVWKQQLLAGETITEVALHCGRVLGRMHESTARDPAAIAPFADRKVFVQLRVEPFYQRIQERRPEVADAVAPLIEQMLTAEEALCHGDFSPKNILTHAGGFMLVDYETAHRGDPTMDLGFFLSHLILKGVKHAGERARYFDLTRAFWRGYAAEVTFRPVEELQARGIGHFGVCVLARIDGTSPVDYLPEEPRRDAARRVGRRVLLERPGRWEDVLGVCEEEVGRILTGSDSA